MNTMSSESRARLEYVRDMLEQLKVVSGAKPGAMFIYFLEMAKLELDDRIAGLDAGSNGKLQ